MRHGIPGRFLTRSVVVGSGTVIWLALVHAVAFGVSEAGRAAHVARDALLVVPLAAIALAAGDGGFEARDRDTRSATVSAVLSAFLLCVMLVPATGLHALIDAALAGGSDHPHGVVAASAGLTHGVRDAALGLIAAIPLALTGRTPVRRPKRRRTMVVAVTLVALAAIPARAEPAGAASLQPFSKPMPIPRVLTGSNIMITMKQADLQILPGRKTRMWTYDGTFPGPTIRRPSGQTTKVTFVNALPSSVGPTSVHLHGAHSASSEDGQPHEHMIQPGKRRTYTYKFWEDGKPERAATHWYHDHAMDHTGRNVWMGLAGMQILDDAVDSALPLPKGPFDVPLMLTDRTFDANNQLVFPSPTKVAAGDRVLVNGAVQPYFNVAARTYRFRIVNASNLVEYRLALSNGRPLVHVASESGLLPQPVRRSQIVVGPGERAEVIVDFAGLLGQSVILTNSAGSVGAAFLRGTPAQNGVAAPPDLLQFRVRAPAVDRSRIPTRLRPAPEFGPPSVTRHFTLDAIPVAALAHGSGEVDPAEPAAGNVFGSMLWTINGLPFDPHRVDARPALGATERWIFTNTSPTRHNVHIHDVDWKVVSRTGGATVFNSVDPDVHLGEAGLKETFVVSAGETVEVVSKFTDHLGRYILHCHILPHEDASMMAQFEVVPPGGIAVTGEKQGR